jgi:hypothetical protein
VFRSNGETVGELPVGLVHEDIVVRPFVGFPLAHPTWCGRTRWFRENPYDPKLRYAEDQDLLLRIYRHSRLAGLDRVLLGYRQDQLALRKLLPGRATFARSAWRHRVTTRETLPALAGIAVQAAKGAADIATVGLGLSRQMQFTRLKPVSPEVQCQWRRLQDKLHMPGNELERSAG